MLEISPDIAALFASIQPHYEAMLEAANCLSRADGGGVSDTSCGKDVNANVKTILDHEASFLIGMDSIVNQYQTDAETTINQLRWLQIITLLGLIALLFLNRLTVFRLAIRTIKQETSHLLRA